MIQTKYLPYITSLALLLLLFNFRIALAQPSMCNGANPFCTGITYNFPATTNILSAQIGVNYGCLLSTPNPVWYYLKVATSGPIVLNIAGAGAGDDIDFACWGPFTGPTSGCTAQLTNNCIGSSTGCTSNTTLPPLGTAYPAGNLVDCSFNSQPAEVCTIPNAVTGQYYMVLITNFAGNATNIVFNQTNASAPGAGSTDCSIINSCFINSLTATPSICNAATNTYSITGTIAFTNAPTTGSLIVANSCGGTRTFNAPFISPLTYSFTNLNSNGTPCAITAAFSASSNCTYTASYTAPAACSTSPICSIFNLSATPSVCNSANNTYSITGALSFTNAPATGSLVITNTCGGSQIISAPFTSPLSYSFTNLNSNGGTCTVTAGFSASPNCFNTTTYIAATACTTCTVSISSNSPLCEYQPLLLNSQSSNAVSYSWSGPNGYTSSVPTPTLLSSQLNYSGTYSLMVIASNSAVCSATTHVSVLPLPLPLFSLVLPDNAGDYFVSGINNSINTSLFYWTFNATDTLRTPAFNYDFKDNGKYQICLHVENSLGCAAKDCYVIELKPDWDVFIPNTFTPNGDNVNDVFYVSGYGINDIKLEVFDRWGSSVFKSNDTTVGWNGKTKNQEIKQDVYTWKVELKDLYGKEHTYVGRVTLVR